VRGWLYDGTNAVRHEVEVARDGAGVTLAMPDGSVVEVERALLTHVESRSGCEVYGRRDLPGWRLGLEAGADSLAALMPPKERYGGWIDRVGLIPALLVGVLVSAVVLFALDRFPTLAAPLVPRAWEKKFGDTLVGDFGERRCSSPEGDAALAKLAARLTPDPARFTIRVVDVPVVNAAALPGGNIVVFDRLLEEARSPDELAGVLAHEMAHVDERHVTQAMIREFGIGAVLGTVGGTAGSGINMLDSLHYSRGAEMEADTDAVESLRRARISPAGTADFFARLAEDEKKLGGAANGLAYVSTHPLSAERERKFRRSALDRRAYTPALAPDEWRALVAICAGREK
jgi:Zn-dependent protease with chaperone function